MLVDSSDFKSQQNIEADICIMGGGVAGIVLANELKENFANIVILESGGEEYQQNIQELYAPAKEPSIYPSPLHSRLRYLGGASNHWSNNTSPLDRIDFEKRDWIENSGWPINYDEVTPFYEKAAVYCQTGTDGYSADYWVHKLALINPYKNSRFTEIGMAKASLPPTRFYASHGDKINNHKNITIYKHANVTDILYSQQTKDIEQVTFNSYTNLEHKVSAKQFIMCFGGIENARMLLHFNQKYENKLGNEFDNVGRYFMDHPTLRAANLYSKDQSFESLSKYEQERFILAFFQLKESALREHETTNLRLPLDRASEYVLSDGISSFHILKDNLSNFELPNDFGKHVSNFVLDIDMVMEAVARKSFDTKIFDSADDFSGYQIPLMMEQTPHRDNRIKLGNAKDKFGIAKVEIEWELKNEDRTRLWKSLELFAKDTGMLSLGRVRLLKERSSRMFSDQIGFGHHHMGTTRMANSPEQGVVDSDQKVFGTNNFYIAGCSVFPTGGHVPPTLTIVALTLRLAEKLKEEKQNVRV